MISRAALIRLCWVLNVVILVESGIILYVMMYNFVVYIHIAIYRLGPPFLSVQRKTLINRSN
jgi:hypothetical protein